jgi:hypothetical protein
MTEKTIYRLLNVVIFFLFTCAIIWICTMDVSTARRTIAFIFITVAFFVAMICNYEDYDQKEVR